MKAELRNSKAEGRPNRENRIRVKAMNSEVAARESRKQSRQENLWQENSRQENSRQENEIQILFKLHNFRR